MKKAILLLAVIVAVMSTNAGAFTLRWDPVTTYTDNTVIPITKTVFYDAWADGTRFLLNGTATSVVIPVPGSGVSHLYEVAAKVDNVSSVRAGFTWTSPLTQPGGPANLRVVP